MQVGSALDRKLGLFWDSCFSLLKSHIPKLITLKHARFHIASLSVFAGLLSYMRRPSVVRAHSCGPSLHTMFLCFFRPICGCLAFSGLRTLYNFATGHFTRQIKQAADPALS